MRRGEKQRSSDERKVPGRNKRLKRGKWIFRRSVIAVSPGALAREREREETNASNHHRETVVSAQGDVVVSDGNIDDKPGKYGWNSCKL